MSKMSRRKQSKPQHISNGSDEEDNAADTSNLKDEPKETNNDTPDTKTAEPVVRFVRFTRKQAQLLRETEKEQLTDSSIHKGKDTKETNNNDKSWSETEAEDSELEDHTTDNPDQDSTETTPKTETHQPMTTDHPRFRDRTCEYCGAVKPTPAALARHLRKHTGERPFVCQGCNKAYKAKRSLQLHQLTYHPELVNKTSPHQAAGVSLCTSSLLREALESRIKQDLANYSGPHLDETTGEFVEDSPAADQTETVNHNTELPEKEKEKPKEPVSMIGALLSKTVDMPTVHKIAFAADGPKNDDEESAEKLSNRTCNICGKVCSKPCDLKRHILMHTGERPFRCEVCGKCFKAKASMLYHQRAAHNMAVELSQGLEERYLRLKNRALMKSLYLQDQILERERTLVAGNGEVEDFDELEELDADFCEANSGSPTPKCGVKINEDFSQSINRQISNTSEASFVEEESSFNESLENGSEEFTADDGEFTCNKLRIRNETVIVTKLDGVNSSTGKEVTMFKCYICGRMFSSLSRVQCHLSMHFELEITTYQCKYCCATFKHKSLMVQHVLKHKIRNDGVDAPENQLSDEDFRIKEEPADGFIDNVGVSPSSESDNTKVKSDGSETSPDQNTNKTTNRFNGAHECKFCRKTFSRQFLLQRHERIHTGQKAFYCKECGKGFSESGNLSQHMDLFHADSLHGKQGTRVFNRAKHRSLLKIAYWDKFSAQSPDQAEDADHEVTEAAAPTPVQAPGPALSNLPLKHVAEDQRLKDMERAKELLEKDGIKEEVTVVMPSAPPTSLGEPVTVIRNSVPPAEPVAEDGDLDENSNSEIMTAPKRSLISFCKDGPPQKSRRKSALPTKLGNSNQPTTMSSSKSPASELEIKIKQEKLDESEAEMSTPTPLNSSDELTAAAYNHTATMIASMNPLLLANHVATSAAGPCLLGAGLLPRLTTASSLGVSTLMNLPISVQVSSGGDTTTTTTKSPSPTQSSSSTSQPSPADPEMLVGCPRVQWNTSGGDDPSPPPPVYARDSSDRKPLPDWHPLSKMTLNHIVTHDGRKVTSLSRTHSRLHVVNQPVDREQVCKPTILPDGRTVYRCIFCSKDFLSFSDINRHMDFHEDIRPYKCQYCDYYARTNSQLKVHMMRHQGIREFCCKLCNYKGVTQSDLNRHMKSQIHMLKSRNECQNCGEGFVTPKNLEKHLEGNCINKAHKMEDMDSSDYQDL